MTGDDLLRHLRDLEVSLHRGLKRAGRARFAELLHGSFAEFGRSGRSYSKADILARPSPESGARAVWSQDFRLTELSEGVALLTYRSADMEGNGELSRHTLRSSIWQQTNSGWQLRFHQGTPTDAFLKDAADEPYAAP